MVKLNSTGSLKKIGTTIYSYSTPIYKEFTNKQGKVLRVFNNTYYSHTTRKHQSKCYEPNADLVVNYAPYGDWSLDTVIKNELIMLHQEYYKLDNKKRLGCNQIARKDEIEKSIKKLEQIAEVF